MLDASTFDSFGHLHGSTASTLRANREGSIDLSIQPFHRQRGILGSSNLATRYEYKVYSSFRE